MPYSFSKEASGAFTCPVGSTDTWVLGLKSHPKGDPTHDPWFNSLAR